MLLRATLFILAFTSLAAAQQIIPDSLSAQKIVDPTDVNHSQKLVRYWETIVTQKQIHGQAFFAIATGSSAKVIVEEFNSDSDLIVDANAGARFALVRLKNVRARNIVIMANAQGPIEIDYIGKIEVSGKIIKILPTTRKIAEEHAPAARVIEGNRTLLMPGALSRYRIYAQSLTAVQ